MAQALAWIITLSAIALVFWLLVRDNDRARGRTSEEWERDFAAGRGATQQFIRAGALGLESILIDEKRTAIEYRIDEQQGMTKTGAKGDDRDRTAADNGED